jgi:hypothetical protein
MKRVERKQNGVSWADTSPGSNQTGESITYRARRISPSGFSLGRGFVGEPARERRARERDGARPRLRLRRMLGIVGPERGAGRQEGIGI